MKRAYRRLAKANHPDAAGEAALPRFLAIQAAYDQIAGPDPGTGTGGRAGATGRRGSRRPWDAERDRAGATYRAYGGRPRRTRRPGAPAAATRPARPRPPAARRAHGPPGDGPRPDGRPRRGRPNKATLGSTSYDGAEAEPFEPDWGGATWYGTTIGTYWTLNPKEYADPRKHGRSTRRAAARRRRGPGAERRPSRRSRPTRRPGDRERGRHRRPPPPTHTTTSWWEATAGPSHRRPPGRSRTPGRRPGDRPGGAPTAAPPPRTAATRRAPCDSPTDAVLAAIRSWLDDDRPRDRRRGSGGRSSAGLPIALGIGWLAGEIIRLRPLRGDLRSGRSPPATWLAQLVAALVLLLAVRGRPDRGGRDARHARGGDPGRRSCCRDGRPGRRRAPAASALGVLAGRRLASPASAVGRRSADVRIAARGPVPYPEGMPRRHDPRDLSAAAQEYLLALRVSAGASDGAQVTAAQVARHLGVTTQAASEMFRRLVADGLVDHADGRELA